MRTWSGGSVRRRPRSVWFALATGIVLCLVIATGVLLPVLGLVGAAATVAPLVLVPIAQITVMVLAGYLLALGLLALCAVTRVGALAWIAAVSAVIATLVVSVAPLVAVAVSAVDDVSQIVPFITGLISQVTG